MAKRRVNSPAAQHVSREEVFAKLNASAELTLAGRC